MYHLLLEFSEIIVTQKRFRQKACRRTYSACASPPNAFERLAQLAQVRRTLTRHLRSRRKYAKVNEWITTTCLLVTPFVSPVIV
jgi:hypothetical protein